MPELMKRAAPQIALVLHAKPFAASRALSLGLSAWVQSSGLQLKAVESL